MITSPHVRWMGIGDHTILLAAGVRDGLMSTSSWLAAFDISLFVSDFREGPCLSNSTFGFASFPAPVWFRPSAQQELLARLASTIVRRVRYFPDEPVACLKRVEDLLLSAILPQKGPYIFVNDPPAASGRISRSRAWELVFLELSTLDGTRRPLRDLHVMLVNVLCMVARNEFPLTIPPRWLAGFFEILNRVVSLQMSANNWSLEASPDMDPDCKAYIAAASKNIENGQRRSRRQWVKFRAQEEETLLDVSGRPLRRPEEDEVVPPVPAGLAEHRPCLWVALRCISTPKRERDANEDPSDEEMDVPEPKRRPSTMEYGGPYGTAVIPPRSCRCSLDRIARNPLRGYPTATALYGLEPGPTLLQHPVFVTNHTAGRDPSRPFSRGEDDPATLAMQAIGARRVPAEEIEMRTWKAELRRIEITHPFTSDSDAFHVYALPERRVANGEALHTWSYGARLGPHASGQWSNLVEGSKQPALPPFLQKSIGANSFRSCRPIGKSDYHAASTRMRVWAGRCTPTIPPKFRRDIARGRRIFCRA